jgi:hypothetical protein
MQKAPVHEHKREKRKYLLTEAKVGGDLWHGVAGRNQPVGSDELVKPVSLRQLHQKEQHIGCNNRVIDHRVGLGFNGVANGYHGVK